MKNSDRIALPSAAPPNSALEPTSAQRLIGYEHVLRGAEAGQLGTLGNKNHVSGFDTAFKNAVETVLSHAPHVRHEWVSESTVKFFASSPDGFDVSLVCESYGVYPYAGEWHGPPWDSTVWEPPALRAEVERFLRSVLSPAASLEVHYSNERPYKWRLHQQVTGDAWFEETGLLFFNWFGKRSTRRFCNTWLPAGDSSP